jgi:hypothetical protein
VRERGLVVDIESQQWRNRGSPSTSSLLDFFKVQRGGYPAVAQRAGALARGVRVSLLAFVGDLLDLFTEGGDDSSAPILRVAIQGDLSTVGYLGIDFGVIVVARVVPRRRYRKQFRNAVR